MGGNQSSINYEDENIPVDNGNRYNWVQSFIKFNELSNYSLESLYNKLFFVFISHLPDGYE